MNYDDLLIRAIDALPVKEARKVSERKSYCLNTYGFELHGIRDTCYEIVGRYSLDMTHERFTRSIKGHGDWKHPDKGSSNGVTANILDHFYDETGLFPWDTDYDKERTMMIMTTRVYDEAILCPGFENISYADGRKVHRDVRLLTIQTTDPVVSDISVNIDMYNDPSLAIKLPLFNSNDELLVLRLPEPITNEYYKVIDASYRAEH